MQAMNHDKQVSILKELMSQLDVSLTVSGLMRAGDA